MKKFLIVSLTFVFFISCKSTNKTNSSPAKPAVRETENKTVSNEKAKNQSENDFAEWEKVPKSEIFISGLSYPRAQNSASEKNALLKNNDRTHILNDTFLSLPEIKEVSVRDLPATNLQVLKSNANSQSSKPTTNSQTAKPATNSQTVKPATDSQTAKPNTNSQVAKSTTNSQNVKPANSQVAKTNSQTAKPATNSQTAKPTTNSQTAKSNTNSQVAKSTTNSQITKPANSQVAKTNSQTAKPATNSQTAKTNSQTAKPAKTNSQNVKPTNSQVAKTNSQTAKPATNSQTAKPTTNSQTTKPATNSENVNSENESEKNENVPIVSSKNVKTSREVTLAKNQFLDVSYPGSGWVYLGELDGKKNLLFFGRKLSEEEVLFSFTPREEGTSILHFYKNDILNHSYIDDYLLVTVQGNAISKTERITAPSYANLVPAKPNAKNESTKNEIAPITKITDAKELENSKNEIANVTEPIESSIEIFSDKPDDLLAQAKKAYNDKKYANALSLVNEFLKNARQKLDEGFFLKGQTLEAKSAVQDIKNAIENYQKIIDDFPKSALWESARKRLIFLKRMYVDIR